MRKAIIYPILLSVLWLYGCGNKISPPDISANLIFPPSDLAALVITGSTLELTWTDNSENENGFEILRRNAGDTSSVNGGVQNTTGSAGDSLSGWEIIGMVSSNTAEYYDSTVVVGEIYEYAVKAYNSNGYSDFSNLVTISFTLPAAPSGLEATVLSDSRVSLIWNDNSDNETNFLVCRQDTGIVIITGILSAGETSFIDTNLNGNTDYSYYIIASNSLGNSSSETIVATTLATISVVGSIPGIISSMPVYITVRGNYLYCAGHWGVYNTLKIIDISTPVSLAALGSLSLGYEIDDLSVDANYAYMTDDSGFVRIDISAPDNPVTVDRYTKSRGNHFIEVSGNYIFLASNNQLPDSILVIQYSDSAGFELIGSYAEPGEISGFYVIQEQAYILTSGELKILDVTNPAAPSVIGYYNPEYSTNEFHVCGDYAYMPNDFGLAIINIVNPLAPVSAGSYLLAGGCDKVFADSSFAYIYNYSENLRAIDIAVPAYPELEARFENSSISSVYVSGNYIYASNNDSLQVLFLDIETP